MSILINIIAILIIFLIIWWFWLSKPKAQRVQKDVIKILVKDGVYAPARIEVKAGQLVVLEFMRLDSFGCSEYVFFDHLAIHEQLPLNRPYRIKLGKLPPGSYPFYCQMKMYAGELVVV